MTSPVTPLCLSCARFWDDDRYPFKCDAFPAGIPDGIFYHAGDHTKPVDGDNGLQYVKGTPKQPPTPETETATRS